MQALQVLSNCLQDVESMQVSLNLEIHSLFLLGLLVINKPTIC